jgi:hypothetical protein
MSDTGTMMWFVGTTTGVLGILAGFVLAASRRDAYRRPHRHSKWPTGPWP